MRTQWVLLADSVEVIPESGGKLNIRGAGVSHIGLPEVPAIGPAIAMVCNLLIEENDFGRPHALHATITRRDDGKRLQGVLAEMGEPMFQRRAGVEFQSTVVLLNFVGLPFERYGIYDIGLVVDDQELASVPFAVGPPLVTASDGDSGDS